MTCLALSAVGFLVAFGLILFVGEVIDAFWPDRRNEGHP